MQSKFKNLRITLFTTLAATVGVVVLGTAAANAQGGYLEGHESPASRWQQSSQPQANLRAASLFLVSKEGDGDSDSDNTSMAGFLDRQNRTQVALHRGDRIPAFELKDQAGQTQTFDSLKGANGLLLMFNQSADWCPFCKSQLIDFESARKNFEAKGIRVASVTYDSPAVLKMFAQRKHINFELLSDPHSKIIDAFGVRNLSSDLTETQAGIAIPNYYLIGPDGVIRERWTEDTLQNRVTANYFYESLFGPGTATSASNQRTAPHLNITLIQSDKHSAPGARVRLAVQLEPEKDTHLYASGAEANGYHPVKLTLDKSELYSAMPAGYPKATIMEFPKLQEKVPVFESKTIITEDVTPVRSPGTMVEFSAHPNLVIHGSLEYQACTSTTCFPPQKVPVEWTLNVRAEDLDSVRAPEELRRK